LRFLNRFDALVPTLLGVATFFLGVAINAIRPDWGTNGMQMLIWGFFISTVVLFHCTAAINSLAHLFGRRRFDTSDHSRNSFLLALLTLGEGWHNNHHRYPAATRQGFYWWELDITYIGLFLMSKLGLIWDLKPVPAPVLASGLHLSKAATQ
jgi:stearoyl-CoA desaturase (delta-9 desaturase)